MNVDNEQFLSDVSTVVRVQYSVKLIEGVIIGSVISLVFLYGLITTALSAVFALLPESFMPWAGIAVELFVLWALRKVVLRWVHGRWV